MYKNVLTDNERNDAFYRNSINNLNIIYAQDASEFNNLNAQLLGRTLDNEFEINDEQPLLLYSTMPNYQENYQCPPLGSHWAEIIQSWEGSESNLNALYTKTEVTFQDRRNVKKWKDIDYCNDDILKYGIKRNTNLIGLNCIGKELISTPLSHRHVVKAYHCA